MPDLPTVTITLFFTGIEGSTRLLQQLGERYATVLDECRQLLRNAFAQWQGQEVATLCRLLSRPEVRLVTLTGPGGIGKTRLGLHVAAELADHFVDGVFLVPLASARDPEQVVPPGHLPDARHK
jgi:hypothetical protein